VIDDLIAYYVSDDEVFLVPNAANTPAVVAALVERAPAGLTITDEHRSYAVLAVQGPKSADVVGGLGLPTDMDYMGYADAEFAGVPVRVCRTGYTGEHGYEIVAPVEVLGGVWDALVAAGATPAGLGARDTLRTEMGYPLHGQDISPTISPVEAGIGWAVGWGKETFAGRDAAAALRAAGPSRRLRGLRSLDRGIPRCHMAVHRVPADGEEPLSGEVVGEVTSGTFSPTLKVGIGLALLACDVAVGDEVVVDVRGRASRFEVVTAPFVSADPRA
jgi:aminomethyltransferase